MVTICIVSFLVTSSFRMWRVVPPMKRNRTLRGGKVRLEIGLLRRK